MSLRKQLANAIEAIYEALGKEFRSYLTEVDENAFPENFIVVNRIGHISLLRGYFVIEILDSLTM